MKYRWVTLEDITRWLVNRTVTEISFTGDAFVADDLEPSGWYGMKFAKEFDKETMIFESWGGGIAYSDSMETGVMGAIKNFSRYEFDWEIYRDTHICCEAEGLPLVDIYESDCFYNLKFNGDLFFSNITKDRAEDIKWALEEGVKYGKELSK